MQKIITLGLISCFVLSLSCNSQSAEESFESAALNFMNDYVQGINNGVNEMEWVQNHESLTASFKSTYRNLIEEGWENDPDIGIGFDPILDAQDYPEKGVKIFKSDFSSGYIILQGKDWEIFKVKVKLIKQGDNWLIDGSGVVNIPIEKQIEK